MKISATGRLKEKVIPQTFTLQWQSWAETNGFSGVAAWMYAQAEEEKLHMLKFIKYINERGGKAVIPAFKNPDAEYKSVEDVFKEVLKHEEFVTAQYK